jgi:hypothetical protein
MAALGQLYEEAFSSKTLISHLVNGHACFESTFDTRRRGGNWRKARLCFEEKLKYLGNALPDSRNQRIKRQLETKLKARIICQSAGTRHHAQ